MPSRGHGLGQAIVMGGSIAGLLSARVLADHFDTVVLVERDAPPAGPVPHKGVPQGQHVHALLEAGLTVMEELFPGLVAEMEGEGVDRVDMSRDAVWLQSGSWKTRFAGGFGSILVSRPHLEWKLRSRVAALPNVQLLMGHGVEELLLDAARTRLTGVRVRGLGGERSLEGALVVDASGRGSRTPQWLEALGLGRVEKEEVEINLGYTSRLYERPAGFDAWKMLVINGQAPLHHRAGYISNVEGGRWIVSLNGYFGDHAPTDDAGFLEFARGLPSPLVHACIRDARPLTAPVTHKIPTSRWLRYERMERLPEGLVLLGDAVCALNPLFGQGMTVSALGAKLLGEHVARAAASGKGLHRGLARRYQKALGQKLALCWLLTSTMDLMHPQAHGRRPPGLGVLQWAFQNMIDLTSRDARACHAFYEVLHMRKGLEGLFQPRFLATLLAYNLRSLVVPRERRANLEVPPLELPPAPPAGGERLSHAA